ncbi:hypothetical protein B0H21DRAFT_823192 [Amylocystis lapponica]|nr:hypothetical protein B0H21DRAFT_823192 [Amylocystis lapponica]
MIGLLEYTDDDVGMGDSTVPLPPHGKASEETNVVGASGGMDVDRGDPIPRAHVTSEVQQSRDGISKTLGTHNDSAGGMEVDGGGHAAGGADTGALNPVESDMDIESSA